MPQRLLLEGSDIDELLLRVRNEHGPQATIVHAEQKLVGGVAGFFARRRYELAVQVDDARGDDGQGDDVQGDAPPRSFEDLLADADGADGGDGARAPVMPPRQGRRVSTQSPQFEDLLTSLVARAERAPDVAHLPADRATPEPSSGPPASGVPTSGAVRGADGRGFTPSRSALEGLGLPGDRVPARPATDPRTAVLDVLAQLPVAPSGRLWGTTVVVGPPDLARRAVEAIAEHTGGTGAEPLVATSGSPSSADLAVRASALCTTHGAAVVVIETPATRAAARRAGKLVAGLGLGTVVAAVDATRDVDATREWLAELGAAGRHVDQVAAFDVAESPRPLALLGLGPQVAWVDGRPATVGTWAAPCLDRLMSGQDGA
ncbi:MAG TPA: hypothetical protein VFL94_09105 [Actinomycetales bacterium]|nr:hypothetical protein [Actinomycetales bacterium]